MTINQTFGQLFFTSMSHSLYDLFVYRLVTPYVWRCQTEIVIDNYHRNLSDNHLEIGVGTGYLIKESEPHTRHLKLSLMDLNKRCVEKSAKRLSEYSPTLYQQDILQPFEIGEKRFDSIGLNFVMHCVPGDFKSKGVAFKHVYDALKNGGVFFGATVLHDGVKRSVLSRLVMKALNVLTIFHNSQDNLDDFKVAIEAVFDLVEIEVVGSTVLWRATKQ